MKSIRILNVNASLDPNEGGSIERTVQMSRFQIEAGEHVRLLVTDKGLTSDRRALFGDRLTVLPSLNDRFYLPRFSFRDLDWIVGEADIIHLMSHWTILNALVFQSARKLGKPYVICPCGSLPLFGRSQVIKRLYNFAIGTRMVREATGLIAVTPKEIPEFERYGAKLAQIRVISNAIDPDHYTDRDARIFRDRLPLGDSPFVLFLGRLAPIKGPDLLIEAFGEIASRFPALHLVLAGPDEGMGRALRSRAADLGISHRVHFAGSVKGSLKSQALHAARLMVIPSRNEAMSIVALEAGAAGLPVLLTDKCGFDEIGNVGGGLVVPATSKDLAKGMCELLSRGEALSEMGRQLQLHVLRSYTWKAKVGEYIEYYRALLGGGPLGARGTLR